MRAELAELAQKEEAAARQVAQLQEEMAAHDDGAAPWRRLDEARSARDALET